MSSYRSTGAANTWLKHDDGLVSVTRNGSNFAVQLSSADRRALALELLEKDYDVKAYFHMDGYTVIRRSPQIGEFYRLKSTEKMIPGFQGDPIVKVIGKPEDELSRFNGELWIQTSDGQTSPWSGNKKGLTGPIEVEVKEVTTVVWEEKEAGW